MAQYQAQLNRTQLRTQLIVRKTIEQLKGEYQTTNDTSDTPLKVLNKFETRLGFNMDLAGIPKVTGRKPKAKSKPPADGKKD